MFVSTLNTDNREVLYESAHSFTVTEKAEIAAGFLLQ